MTREWIYTVAFGGLMGMNRIDAALASPGAPKPTIGGRPGIRTLWNGSQVVAWVDKISKPGCWPVPQKEAA